MVASWQAFVDAQWQKIRPEAATVQGCGPLVQALDRLDIPSFTCTTVAALKVGGVSIGDYARRLEDFTVLPCDGQDCRWCQSFLMDNGPARYPAPASTPLAKQALGFAARDTLRELALGASQPLMPSEHDKRLFQLLVVAANVCSLEKAAGAARYHVAELDAAGRFSKSSAKRRLDGKLSASAQRHLAVILGQGERPQRRTKGQPEWNQVENELRSRRKRIEDAVRGWLSTSTLHGEIAASLRPCPRCFSADGELLRLATSQFGESVVPRPLPVGPAECERCAALSTLLASRLDGLYSSVFPSPGQWRRFSPWGETSQREICVAADRLLGDRGDGFAELPVGKADEALGRRAVSLLKWLDFKVDAYSDADGRNLGKHVEAMRRWVTDDGGTLAVAAATALATVDMGAAELLSLGDCVAQVRRRALAASPEEVADRLHAHGMWAMEKHEGLLVQHRANVLELPSIGDAAVLGIRIMLIANLYGELYRLLPIRPLT